MSPIKFRPRPMLGWEKMSFEEFYDGRGGGHLGYPNGMILKTPNLCVALSPSIKFQSIRLRVWEDMSLKNVNMAAMADIRWILAKLNFYVSPMPLVRFRFNPTYCFGGDVD